MLIWDKQLNSIRESFEKFYLHDFHNKIKHLFFKKRADS